MFPLSLLGASTCKRHERPLSAKYGITGEKWPVNFACDFDFHVNPGFFDMPRKSATWETALLPLQGRHAVDFFARKIRRSWVPEASMLTTRPPKPLGGELLNKKCVFWFSLQLLSETFLILGRTEREIVLIQTSLQRKFPSFSTDLNQIRNFVSEFSKKN